MVKAYLRYEFRKSFGVVAGLGCGACIVRRTSAVKKHFGERCALAVSPAVSAVMVWNLKSGEAVHSLVDDSARDAGTVTALSAALSGKRVGVGYSDGSVRVWSILSGKLEGVFAGHVSAVLSIAWGTVDGEDSVLVSGSADGEIVVWDPIAEKGRFRLQSAHAGPVTVLSIVDGYILSGSKDGLVKVFEVETQTCVQTVVGHPGEVWCMDVKNGLVVTGSVDRELRVWRFVGKRGLTNESDVADENGRRGNSILDPIGSFVREGSSRCVHLKFNSKGTLFAVHGTEKSVQFFHVRAEDDAKKHRNRRRKRKTEKAEATAQQDDSSIQDLEAVDFFHHARSVRTDYKVRSVDFVSAGSKIQVLVHLHHNLLEVLEVGLGRGGSSGGTGNTLRSVMRIDGPGHRGDIRALALASDDNTIVSLSSSKTAKVWNTAKQVFDVGSGEELLHLPDAHSGALWGMELLPEERGLVTCGADHKVKFWSMDSSRRDKVALKLQKTLELGDDVLCVSVTRNGKFVLASLLDSTVRAFYVDTLKPYLSFYGHKLPVLSMSISDDDTMLATGSADKSVKLWGLDFGDCRKSLRAHDGPVMTVTFQPDTHYLFTGSRDGKLKYWDADRFELITELPGQRGEVWASVCGRDGELVATASDDKSIRVWQKTDEMMFIEEEKNKRLEGMLEESLQEDERERRSSAPIVPEEVTKETSLAGKRTMDAVRGGEALMEAIELAEVEKMRREEDPSEPANIELQGLSAELFLLKSLKKIRKTDLESTLQLLTMKDAMKILSYCSTWLQEDAAARVDIELINRTVMYLIRSFHEQLAISGDRSLVSSLSSSLHKRLNEYRDNLGFNLAAIEVIQSEIRLETGGPLSLPEQSSKRRRRTHR